MQVILIEDVEKLGRKGEILKVKGGYFRNYLFPRGKAVPSTDGNIRSLKEWKGREELRQKREKEAALALARKLEKVSLILKAQVGEEDKLFGAVTNQEIARALKDQGIDLDKKKIDLEEPIRKTGTAIVRIKLHPEVEGNLTVKVVKG